MNKIFRSLIVALFTLFLSTNYLLADNEFIDDTSGIKVSLYGRLQLITVINDSDFEPNDSIDYKIRRARLKMVLDFNPEVSLVLQNELSNAGRINDEVQFVDAYVKYKPDNWWQVLAGINMAPAQRQNLTSAGAMLAFDRPGITNYNLTWGMKGNTAMQTGTVPGTRLASFGANQVRDVGLTLFGSGELSKDNYLKYYVSTAEGSRYADNTSRGTVRVQWNQGDAEPGYYNRSTYMGKKETFGLGFVIDRQDSIAADAITGEGVDYSLFSVDAFYEKPYKDGFLTLESAYLNLDLGDTPNPLATFSFEPLSTNPASQTQGHGVYLQAGYLEGDWQPWALIEAWQTDDPLDNGSWHSARLGFTYYTQGVKANIKIGIEHTRLDGFDSNSINTVAIGIFFDI